MQKIDINVDTKKYNLEEVSAYIYKKYMETLKARGIDYEKELENL